MYAFPLILALFAHPNSFSSTRLTVEGATVEHELVLQALSLIEVLPESDIDLDGQYDAAEVEAARAGIADYVTRNYQLWAGPDRAQLLEREVLSVELAPAPDGLTGPESNMVLVRSQLRADAPITELAAEMRLFFVTSPGHTDFYEVIWDGERAFASSLSQFEPKGVFREEELPFRSVWEWLLLGAERFFTSLERLAFLVALFLSAACARRAAALGAAYGLTQTAGYALAVLFAVELPARFLGLAIALSSAFAGAQLLARREARALFLEGVVFAALGGLAFGRDALNATRDLLLPKLPLVLLGLGELAAVAACGALGAVSVKLCRRAEPAGDGSPSLGRGSLTLAAVVTLFGLYRFVLRAGWL